MIKLSSFFHSSIRSILLGKEDLHESCESRNTNQCAQRACTVEGQFVLNIGKAYISGDVFDKEPSHAAGFDTSICHNTVNSNNMGVSAGFGGNGGNGEKDQLVGINRQVAETGVSLPENVELSCCGKYPNRFPYHSEDKNKKCCENSQTGISKVYDSGLYECCDDGSTMVTCG